MSLQWNCAITIKQGRLTTQLVNAMKRHGGDVGGGFDRVLLLTVEINDGLINSMHNPGYGAAGDKVMVEIGVDPCRGDDGIT